MPTINLTDLYEDDKNGVSRSGYWFYVRTADNQRVTDALDAANYLNKCKNSATN